MRALDPVPPRTPRFGSTGNKPESGPIPDIGRSDSLAAAARLAGPWGSGIGGNALADALTAFRCRHWL